jgi:hypothetical protein
MLRLAETNGMNENASLSLTLTSFLNVLLRPRDFVSAAPRERE